MCAAGTMFMFGEIAHVLACTFQANPFTSGAEKINHIQGDCVHAAVHISNDGV
jgi:hypothetical protein